MKQVGLIVGALILLGFAAVVIWSNRHALTTVHLAFSGGCIALAFMLAIPADFKNACESVASLLPAVRGNTNHDGGR